ncbi:MAG TPA: hypothetical protein VM535_00345, partial [Candidatus Saccharimonadales bacterium]|nr:hypothetical protein [Candidatus Saccharimonadales bacterium]
LEAPLDWQELVAAQFDLAEEPRTLEDIQAEAEEQPLEQTLMQLVKHLSESAAEPESHEVWEITEGIAAEASPNPKITPELTDQLLALLRVLGYQNPREVLVDFVKKYDLAFLLQALRYIWELSSSRERPDTNLIGYNACAPEAAGL